MENYEMLWIIVTASFSGILSIYFGYKRFIYLHQLTLRNLSIAVLMGTIALTLLLILYKIEIMNENVGVAIITNMYASICGFFSGSAFNQFKMKKNAGAVLYAHRSFLIDHASVILALGFLLFGVFRTAIFTDLPLTPIRVSSGFSIVAFAVWGLTLRLVPEFRQHGIILLDYKIDWENFLNYSWYLIEVIEIEYQQNDWIKHFKTFIPHVDHSILEDILRKKMMEKVSISN